MQIEITLGTNELAKYTVIQVWQTSCQVDVQEDFVKVYFLCVK